MVGGQWLMVTQFPSLGQAIYGSITILYLTVLMDSWMITISNNYFTHHNEVILLGHSDSYTRDKQMQVTIAYNHFREGLIQRMPRCRHGYFHVVNDYTHWEMYAIGGSADPTINSQGNRFTAPNNPFAKEVTKRVDTDRSNWHGWNCRSEGDLLLNGAYFIPSGAGSAGSYARASSLGAKSSSLVGTITANAGVIMGRGRHRHGATATTYGYKINLIMWCRRLEHYSKDSFSPLRGHVERFGMPSPPKWIIATGWVGMLRQPCRKLRTIYSKYCGSTVTPRGWAEDEVISHVNQSQKTEIPLRNVE
ncbi:probable pectate lyase 8 [Tanacetum coccineum]